MENSPDNEEKEESVDDDFRKVNHDECIYKVVGCLLDLDNKSLSNLWTDLREEIIRTRDDGSYQESLKQAVARKSIELSEPTPSDKNSA
ncbi:hypothetical protein ACFLUG_04690 [Chloroflexota bacterium]